MLSNANADSKEKGAFQSLRGLRLEAKNVIIGKQKLSLYPATNV